jgi:hypothetical protein
MLPAGPAPADEELAAYCPDLDPWPRSWMYEERDVSPGRHMVECFKPFLRHLLSLGLSRKTLRQHRDNLWLLGGELIRDLHDASRLRKRPMDQVVLAALDREGGPLISHRTYEDQQRSFDATCRKFHRFLTDRGSPQAVRLWTCGQR